MTESLPARRFWLTRDQVIGIGVGLVVILGCLLTKILLDGRDEPSMILRDSKELLPANAVSWFTFSLSRDGDVELEATTAHGETFNLYVLTRPAAGRRDFPGFRMLPEFIAENVSSYRAMGSLPRGEYHVMVMRAGSTVSAAMPAQLHLRLHRVPAVRARRRRRRFSGFGVPAKPGSPPALLGGCGCSFPAAGSPPCLQRCRRLATMRPRSSISRGGRKCVCDVGAALCRDVNVRRHVFIAA